MLYNTNTHHTHTHATSCMPIAPPVQVAPYILASPVLGMYTATIYSPCLGTMATVRYPQQFTVCVDGCIPFSHNWSYTLAWSHTHSTTQARASVQIRVI